jgi:hypothetical protein
MATLPNPNAVQAGIMNNPLSQCAQSNPISQWLCKAFGGTPNSQGGGGSSGSTGISLYDWLTKPINLVGGIRHVFLRMAEVLVGGVLVIIGLNALVKSEPGKAVSGATKTVTKTARKLA